jgi:hypothetical protein
MPERYRADPGATTTKSVDRRPAGYLELGLMSGGNMDTNQRSELIRLEARLGAFEDLKAEIEPWLMEERDVSAREALDNVIAHLDAEIVELHRRREEIERGTPAWEAPISPC